MAKLDVDRDGFAVEADLDQLYVSRLLFRGQADARWTLKTTLERQAPGVMAGLGGVLVGLIAVAVGESIAVGFAIEANTRRTADHVARISSSR